MPSHLFEKSCDSESRRRSVDTSSSLSRVTSTGTCSRSTTESCKSSSSTVCKSPRRRSSLSFNCSPCSSVIGSCLSTVLGCKHSRRLSIDDKCDKCNRCKKAKSFELVIHKQINLRSDIPNAARYLDSNIKNSWGIALSNNHKSFWVGNNHSGTLEQISFEGKLIKVPILVPTPTSPTGGAVTGITVQKHFHENDRRHRHHRQHNHKRRHSCDSSSTLSSSFKSSSSSSWSQDCFAVKDSRDIIFVVTEDGTIGLFDGLLNPNSVVIKVDNSSVGAVYKGVALFQNKLYAANFNSGNVEVYDVTNLIGGSFPLLQAFTDLGLMTIGYAPFNVAILKYKVYVSFALQNAEKADDVAGVGNGFIDVFSLSGRFLYRLINRGALNSPWSMVLFEKCDRDILIVGNFGNGEINLFDLHCGKIITALQDGDDHILSIDHLWGLLRVGRNRLFFAAGINSENDGLVGVLKL